MQVKIFEFWRKYLGSVFEPKDSERPLISDDAVIFKHAANVNYYTMFFLTRPCTLDHNLIEDLVDHLKIGVCQSFLILKAQLVI